MNEYCPWESEGITEVEYWKRQCLIQRNSVEKMSATVMELLVQIDRCNYGMARNQLLRMKDELIKS